MIDFHVISICLPGISSSDLWHRVTERHDAAHAWSVVRKKSVPLYALEGQRDQDEHPGGEQERNFPFLATVAKLRPHAAATKVEG